MPQTEALPDLAPDGVFVYAKQQLGGGGSRLEKTCPSKIMRSTGAIAPMKRAPKPDT
jgi:hypothetical protein